MQGRAAGVTAVQTSGAPGSASSIRVRGQATINSNAEPLYVIDGVIVQGGSTSGSSLGFGDALDNGTTSTISPLSTINPADILSMEILKDASATAIYGAQGANGVVLITTKRGRAGEAKFSYDGMMAVSRQTKRLDMLNLRGFGGYYNDFVASGFGGVKEDPYYSHVSLLGGVTNWQGAIFQTSFQQQPQVSAQVGTEKIQYYVSAGYMDQEGTIIGSDFNRLSLRVNLDAQLKKWLKLGLSATFADSNDDIKLADGAEGIVGFALTSLPEAPIYDIDGNYASFARENYSIHNPIAKAMEHNNMLNRKKLSGNIYAELTPIKNITWHAELGYDIGYSKAEVYNNAIDLPNWKEANESSIQKNNNTFWQLKNYVTYNNTFAEKHSVSAMVGQECWESKYDYTMAQIVDGAGMDVILVGDSASNVMAGNVTTLPITLDQMIYHAKSVVRGVKRAMVVVDMPFGSYQGNEMEGLASAIRIMKESHADALKLEGGEEIIGTVKRILSAGIPIMGHLGLMPQSINKYGTYTVRAKDDTEAEKLISDAHMLEEAGCFAIVLEKIPAALAERVASELTIPIIGIGAGGGVDGQVLVIQDMLGMNNGFRPRFLRRYADLHTVMTDAISRYVSDVKNLDFPNEKEQY